MPIREDLNSAWKNRDAGAINLILGRCASQSDSVDVQDLCAILDADLYDVDNETVVSVLHRLRNPDSVDSLGRCLLRLSRASDDWGQENVTHPINHRAAEALATIGTPAAVECLRHGAARGLPDVKAKCAELLSRADDRN